MELYLLILVEPINPNNQQINFPIFVIFYDSQENIIDKQYFRVNAKLNYLEEINNYEMTEVITKLTLAVDFEKQVESITIGFVKI